MFLRSVVVDSEAADTRSSACRNSGSWSGEKLDYFLVGVPAQLAGAILPRCSADITGMKIWMCCITLSEYAREVNLWKYCTASSIRCARIPTIFCFLFVLAALGAFN